MALSRGTSNGPDWKDIAAAMEAVQDYHNVTVSVTIGVIASPVQGNLVVKAEAVHRGKLSTGVKRSVCRSCRIGSGGPAADTARIFRLIHELDRDCGQMWFQGGLFDNV